MKPHRLWNAFVSVSVVAFYTAVAVWLLSWLFLFPAIGMFWMLGWLK